MRSAVLAKVWSVLVAGLVLGLACGRDGGSRAEPAASAVSEVSARKWAVLLETALNACDVAALAPLIDSDAAAAQCPESGQRCRIVSVAGGADSGRVVLGCRGAKSRYLEYRLEPGEARVRGARACDGTPANGGADPGPVCAAYARAVAHRAAGRPAEALAASEELAALVERDPLLLAFQAHLLVELGRRDEARARLAAAVLLDPDVAEWNQLLDQLVDAVPGPRVRLAYEPREDGDPAGREAVDRAVAIMRARLALHRVAGARVRRDSGMVLLDLPRSLDDDALERARAAATESTRVRFRLEDVGAPSIDASSVRDAVARRDTSTGRAELVVHLDWRGAERLADLTSAHVGGKLALLLGDEVVHSAVIASPIVDGTMVVLFPDADRGRSVAARIAAAIERGALPVELVLVSSGNVEGPGVP